MLRPVREQVLPASVPERQARLEPEQVRQASEREQRASVQLVLAPGRQALPVQLVPGLALPESRREPELPGQRALQPVPERELRALVQERPELELQVQPVLQSSPD